MLCTACNSQIFQPSHPDRRGACLPRTLLPLRPLHTLPGGRPSPEEAQAQAGVLPGALPQTPPSSPGPARSCPRAPRPTRPAAESRGTGLAGPGVQAWAAVGARVTPAAASVLGDTEATSVQGLGAPGAGMWAAAAGGAVVREAAAAKRRPQAWSRGRGLAGRGASSG